MSRGAFFLSFLALVCTVSCSNRAAQLPVYDSVPGFTATDSSGRPFTRQDMSGSAWVVDFIYTNCPAECPLMSSRMRRVAHDLENETGVRFLSISVDPARDTPAALEAFAKRYGGASARWKFITGTPEMVHLLAFETFHVGDVLGKIEHSTKFMAVDKAGRIRGYYASGDPQDIAKLKADVKSLAEVKP